MVNEPVLVDTGPLISLYSPNDQHHAICKSLFDEIPLGKAYTCWPVITEAAYLLMKWQGQKQRDDLLESLQDGSLVLVPPLRERDIEPVKDIFTKYHDQQVDLADACLLHLADREDINSVATLDRRHFSIFRKLNGRPLKLLPEFA